MPDRKDENRHPVQKETRNDDDKKQSDSNKQNDHPDGHRREERRRSLENAFKHTMDVFEF